MQACAAIVGCADLTMGDAVAPVLEALGEAGAGRVRMSLTDTDERVEAAVTGPDTVERAGPRTLWLGVRLRGG